MLTRMDDDPDRHLHSTVFQHLRKGLAQPLPKIGIVRDALVIDDDQQVVIGAVSLFRVRLVDPIAARIAAVQANLVDPPSLPPRSEEHTSELQSLMRISYAVFCLKKKKHTIITNRHQQHQTVHYK